MERTFNSYNCKISTLLKSVNLEHLHHKLVQKCVTLDTFLNLTEEDLDYLEITDKHERHILLNNFHFYQQHFKEIIHPPPFDRNKMLMTSLQQLKAINSLTSTMLNEVTRQKATGSFNNVLLDDVTPVSKLMLILCKEALSSLDLIQSDLSTELQKLEGKSWRSWWKKRSGNLLPQILVTSSVTLLIFLSWNQFKSFTKLN